MKDKSLARELLEDEENQVKRLTFMWGITFIALICLLIYTIKLQSDIGSTTETIEIDGVETIDNSHIKIGDDVWERLE